MSQLTPDQRNYYYLLEAERTGVHKPILAALHYAHRKPSLKDGETGLGVVAAGSVMESHVDTFPEQVQYAANLVRSFTDHLADQGWKGSDLWNTELGRYSNSFVELLADGFGGSPGKPVQGRLEKCDRAELLQAYKSDTERDYEGTQAAHNLVELDRELLSLVERLSQYFIGLPHQRDALLEAVRIWRKQDSVDATVQSLVNNPSATLASVPPAELDLLLKQFMQRVSPHYEGYPHQREALLRLTQYWRQLRSREEAIASLDKDTSPDSGLKHLDPALIAFVERIPEFYQGQGQQRNALTEGFRLWRNLDSRQTAVATLGINPALLASTGNDPQTLRQVAMQLDHELLNFVRRVPSAYQEKNQQREALIRMVQLWRGLSTYNQAIESLSQDLQRIQQQRKEAAPPPKPVTIVVPSRPARWTTSNIQLSASILPNGNFTWTEATRGGTRMPPNQATVDAIVRIATLAQQARDRLGRPLIITSWYRPPHINRAVGGASQSRHIVGDAIDFVCEGLSGNQIYWSLDPWWPGGLGRYGHYPNLCHIDARGHRARWG
ncbi:peptidase M15A [Spirulina subsalsa FACHB-351]|uniref:Peptidase M15A n=1 Tax=Spirulina subsalsa FACHB-351 TaxID=234711 RepID=A0ABT3LA18_9CYAN|nr:D-Ala-D-Ala carboxypeptidase family metallohydrolase [Spirulina subsalsa]MCW6038353.1 peptidase M15A [Spirulina subsalsa FACHB-351]